MSTRVDTLGRYRLLEPVGHGGMAIVYRGHDDELGRPVAVKLLADNLADDDAFRKRFLREARLAARLQHPNIVHVYDTGERDGRPFIVMEYVDGETLAEVLAREGRLEPRRAVSLTTQACNGLEHAHRAGLVHRDVKPQNLLLQGDGTLKIVDFGIARSARGTRLTEIGSILGTAAYLAPEQAAGEDVTPAADVYALGVVLYELLAGRTPHTVESLDSLLVAQREQTVPALRDRAPEIPAALEDAVMRCLARLPEYRPASAGALAELLAVATSEPPTQPLSASTRISPAEEPPPEPRPYRAQLRYGRLLAILAVAALAVAGLAALLAGAGGGRAEPSQPAAGSAARPPLEQARDLSRWLRAQSP